MKLIDFVKIIDEVDEELTIYQENQEDLNSDIILDYEAEDDQLVKQKDGKKYSYLIGVYTAKDFIDGWLSNLNFKPTDAEITQRLHEYAVNDA